MNQTDELIDLRPIDDELRRLVMERREALMRDPEWDHVLCRFLSWAVSGEDDVDEREASDEHSITGEHDEEVEDDPIVTLTTLPTLSDSQS